MDAAALREQSGGLSLFGKATKEKDGFRSLEVCFIVVFVCLFAFAVRLPDLVRLRGHAAAPARLPRPLPAISTAVAAGQRHRPLLHRPRLRRLLCALRQRPPGHSLLPQRHLSAAAVRNHLLFSFSSFSKSLCNPFLFIVQNRRPRFPCLLDGHVQSPGGVLCRHPLGHPHCQEALPEGLGGSFH